MSGEQRPILCLDFDGVIHSFTSGWQGAEVIPDPPVPGTMEFLDRAIEVFDVAIFSSRSNLGYGIQAMQLWLKLELLKALGWGNEKRALQISDAIKWPTEKPPAKVTLDDRAITFTGEWPAVDDLLAFKPWYHND